MRSPRSWQNTALTLVIAGVLLLALGGYLTPITQRLLPPLVQVQGWFTERYNAIYDFVTAPRDMAQLRQQNIQLEAEIARLQGQVIDLQQQLAETRVLSALLDFARANPQNEYLAATVIGRDPSPFLHYVLINRGSDDGLRRGMPVVTQQGLVGRVAAVTSGAARVQLITDPATFINVRIQPSNADAALTGSVTGEVFLDFIPLDAAVLEGDLIVTSGLGGSYLPNILIGQVTGVRKREQDLFQSASVQPVVDFERLQVVLIIVNFSPPDLAPLIPQTPQ